MENCTQHFCQKTTFLLHPSNKISTSQRQNSLNVQRSMARRQLTVTERCRNVSGGGKRKRRRGEGARKWVSCQIWKRRANQRRKGVSQVIERWWDSRRDRHTANGRRWSRKVSDAKSCRSSLARPRIYSANIVPWRDEKWENMGIKCAWKVGPLRLFLALQPKDSRLGMFSPAWVEVYRWCICALCDITKGQFPINWRFLEGTRWKVDWAKQAQGELFFFFSIYRYTNSLISAQNRNSASSVHITYEGWGSGDAYYSPQQSQQGCNGASPTVLHLQALVWYLAGLDCRRAHTLWRKTTPVPRALFTVHGDARQQVSGAHKKINKIKVTKNRFSTLIEDRAAESRGHQHGARGHQVAPQRLHESPADLFKKRHDFIQLLQ